MEASDGERIDYDLSEPTMGEKLESLNLQNINNGTGQVKQDSSPRTKPPSADSIHILLKQALHAGDRALLLHCLYTRDEKVISNSISQLNLSDVLKFLDSLLSIVQSDKGTVMVCALPWLRSLLLQQSSGIVSQESSLKALNSLYQLIESRVSTFQSALQLSGYLDFVSNGVVRDVVDDDAIKPIIFEDKDDSDVEESEDAMETDQKNEEERHIEGDDVISD